MAICSTPLKSGIYLGFLLGGICFIGLMVLCPPPTDNHFWVSMTDSVPPDTARKILDDYIAKSHRYLGRNGIDLIWGYDPKPDFKNDVNLPFGLLLLPVFIFGITTLVYVAVVRCRFLVSGYQSRHIVPSPSETSETTPR